MLARLRLQFPNLRRGTGKATQKSEAAWLAECKHAREMLRDFARELSLEDLDLQFLLCELSRLLGQGLP